jgi:flagellar motor switch protein FliM
MGEVRGIMNLCIPFNCIERHGSKLSANTWSYGKSSVTPESKLNLARQINHAQVEIVVTLAETRIKTSELLGLRIGDVITTEKDIRTPLEVAIQGVPKFAASPGAIKGHKAVQIQSPLAAVATPAVTPPAAKTA